MECVSVVMEVMRVSARLGDYTVFSFDIKFGWFDEHGGRANKGQDMDHSTMNMLTWLRLCSFNGG